VNVNLHFREDVVLKAKWVAPLAVLVLEAAPSPYQRLQAAYANQLVVWQFSTTQDILDLLGAPLAEEKQADGGMEILHYRYDDDLTVTFGREAGTDTPFGLVGFQKEGDRTRWRFGDPLALRSAKDLALLRPFTGLQNVDASKADLRDLTAQLQSLPFDTLTRWPSVENMPLSYAPSTILERGRNPGLGLRALQAKGIDGRGVDIAVIDQPLVADHPEIQGRLHMVAELDVEGISPQMHGPAVTSIAAGATCGVAPGASLYYVSMPMWKARQGNAHYIKALEGLLALNHSKKANIRAVSISYGAFALAPMAGEWQAVLDRAEREGVLVITCDALASGLDYGLLRPLAGGDTETAEGYTQGTYGGALLVPGDGRTYASNLGKGAYSFAPMGGMSWGAPWLVGLAALGFQSNPHLTPTQIRTNLLLSATAMPYGKVVNPGAFLRRCKVPSPGGPG
jgi:hypothetical protein